MKKNGVLKRLNLYIKIPQHIVSNFAIFNYQSLMQKSSFLYSIFTQISKKLGINSLFS